MSITWAYLSHLYSWPYNILSPFLTIYREHKCHLVQSPPSSLSSISTVIYSWKVFSFCSITQRMSNIYMCVYVCVYIFLLSYLVTNNSGLLWVSLWSETDLICLFWPPSCVIFFCKRMEASYMNALRLGARFSLFLEGFLGSNHCFWRTLAYRDFSTCLTMSVKHLHIRGYWISHVII